MSTGHELKGVMAYYNCHIPGLYTPMTAIIDFRGGDTNMLFLAYSKANGECYIGFRLLAMSLVPISSDTLCYGSSDAGKTVLNSNPTMNAIMRYVPVLSLHAWPAWGSS